MKPKNSDKPIIIHGQRKRNVKNLYYNTNEDGVDAQDNTQIKEIRDADDLINTVEQQDLDNAEGGKGNGKEQEEEFEDH